MGNSSTGSGIFGLCVLAVGALAKLVKRKGNNSSQQSQS